MGNSAYSISVGGFYFSINHKMVASHNGQQILQALPKSVVLIETDAPFVFAGSTITRQQSLLKIIEGLALQWRCQPEEAKQYVWERFSDMVQAALLPLVDKK
jgi:TatD DNase family protein